MERPENICSPYAFTGNPIIITDPEPPLDAKEVEYTVNIGESEVYRGRYIPPFRVNISEICKAYSDYFPDAICTDTTPVREVVSEADLLNNRMVASVWGNEMEYSTILIPGGVSKDVFRLLAGAGTDIFRERFLNHRCNFFFTLRGGMKKLNIPEAETAPVYFIIDETCDISFSTKFNVQDYGYVAEKGIHAIDFGALRRYFAINHNILPGIFDIYIDQKLTCSVILEHSSPALETYTVRYRSSLGVFERIRICGELVVSPSLKEEDIQAQQYDPLIDGYRSIRIEREETGISLDITTLIENTERLNLYRDMISSNEVYLEIDGRSIEVIPDSEDFKWGVRMREPVEINMKFRVVESDTLTTPDCFVRMSWPGGIFTEEFSDEFK